MNSKNSKKSPFKSPPGLQPISEKTLIELNLKGWKQVQGGGYIFKIKGMLGKGGGTCYTILAEAEPTPGGNVQRRGARIGNHDRRVILKFPKPSADERTHSDTFAKGQSINSATAVELNALYDLNELSGVAHLVGVVSHNIRVNEQLEPFHIAACRFIEGLDLDDWCRKKYSGQDGKFRGVPDEKMWFHLVSKLTETTKQVHANRLIHGDLWPSNVRVKEMGNGIMPRLILIDFGRATGLEPGVGRVIHDNVWFPHKAPELITNHKTRNPESQGWFRWHATIDVYALGAVFLYLATGDDFFGTKDRNGTYQGPFRVKQEVQSKAGFRIPSESLLDFYSNEEIKDEITEAIKANNPKLFAANPGIVDVILYCLRPRLDDRAPSVLFVDRTIRMFRGASNAHSSRAADWAAVERKAKKNLADIKAISLELKRSRRKDDQEKGDEKNKHPAGNPLLCELVSEQLDLTHGEITSVKDRLVTRFGARDSMIRPLVRAMLSLQAGDYCQALTTANFWRKGNVGPNGRFLTAIRMAVRKGATVNWVILVHRHAFEHRHANDTDSEIHDILKYQQMAWNEFTAWVKGRERRRRSDKPCYDIRYRILDEEEYNKVHRARETHILLCQSGRLTLVAPDYQGAQFIKTEPATRRNTLTTLRFWSSPKRVDEFERIRAKHATGGDAHEIASYEPLVAEMGPEYVV